MQKRVVPVLAERAVSVSASQQEASELPARPLFFPKQILFPVTIRVLHFEPRVLEFHSEQTAVQFAPVREHSSPLFPF